MEEGWLCIVYVGQQGDGSTFNCLVNGARTETECSFFVNIYIYIVKLRNVWLIAIGSLPFLRCLDEEHTNLKQISGCQYPTL